MALQLTSARARGLAGIVAATTLAISMAGTAVAAPEPVAIAVTDAHLTARIQVTLGVDVVCQPLVSRIDGSPITIADFGLAASVDQANGRTIAHAAGGDSMPDPSNQITCDGVTSNHLSDSMLSSTVPFHGGTAIATVRVYVDDPACTFCGSGQSGTTTETVKLAG